VPVARLPGACRGLGPRQLDQAITIAVSHFASHGDKAIRRHLAGQTRAHLRYLVAAARRAEAGQAARRRSASRHAATAAAASTRVPIGLATLLAWLLTATSGAFLLAKWLAQASGRRPGRPGAPPVVVLSHLGLALGGLAAWSSYLLTSWAPLAWLALAFLLPVVGLGISTLMVAIPDPSPDPAVSPARSRPSGRARPPVLVIVAHGALAALTVILALLGAVAAVLPR
jgi:manganese efflux pump family protein